MLDWMKKYKKTLIYSGLTFLACILLVGSIVLLLGRSQTPSSSLEGEAGSEPSSLAETETVQASVETEEISAAFNQIGLQKTVNDQLSISARLRSSWEVNTEPEEIEIPPVEVAPVNDAEDPENNKVQEEAEKGNSEEISIEDVIQNGGGSSSSGNTGSTGSTEGSSSSGETSGSGGEESSVSYGIDVSKWQGSINWQKVAESGVEFAIIRCGYRGNETGKIVMDPYFERNIQGAISNGIAVGVYFYSQSIDEAEARQEAAWVVEVIKNYKITYPVVFDYEGIGQNRIENVTKTQRTNNALAFMDYIRSAGYTPMMYASKNGYLNNWETSRFTNCKIWLAHYTVGGKPSDYTGRYDMWQYTSKGSVPGISGNCDLDIAYFKYGSDASTSSVTEVTCQVTDTAGEPVAGATITLSGDLKYTAVTGADGVARFSDVRLDSYEVELTALPAGYSGSGKKTVSIDAAQSSFQIEGFVVNKAEETTPPESSSEPSSEAPESGQEVMPGVTVTAASGTIEIRVDSTLNIRSLPDTSGGRCGYARNGDTFPYTGICSNGWYQIIYNGQVAYVSGEYAYPI